MNRKSQNHSTGCGGPFYSHKADIVKKKYIAMQIIHQILEAKCIKEKLLQIQGELDKITIIIRTSRYFL